VALPPPSFQLDSLTDNDKMSLVSPWTSNSGDSLPLKIRKAVVERTEGNPSLMEAITGNHWDIRWLPAIQKEFKKLDDMGTYKMIAYIDIPQGAVIYPTKMVLSTKRDIVTGEYAAAKARLVVVGNVLSVKVQKFFALTSNDKSLKLYFVLAIAL
jgi:hypothetical protein